MINAANLLSQTTGANKALVVTAQVTSTVATIAVAATLVALVAKAIIIIADR